MEREIPRSVAGYEQVWEADLTAAYLEERGIPAWVDDAGLDNPYRTPAGGLGLIHVLVPAERVGEAKLVLAGMRRDLELPAEDPGEAAVRPSRRPPLWVSVVGFLVVVALAVAAVPHGFRIPVGLVAGYLLWRLARGPSPPSPGGPAGGDDTPGRHGRARDTSAEPG